MVGSKIVAKGEEIRVLKAGKADKATLQPHVDELLSLKKQYKEMTGADFVANGGGGGAAKSAPLPAPPAAVKKGPTPPAPPAVAGASKLTGEAAEVEKAIIAKGEEIRQLKAKKADKASLEVGR